MAHCSVCKKSGHNKRFHSKENIISKKCNNCNTEKPINEFYEKRKINSGGREAFYLSHICKQCDHNSAKSRTISSFKLKVSHSFYAARTRAKLQNIPFNISIDYLMNIFEKQKGRCYYSGIEMKKEGGDYTISIDKINPSKGYIIGNIALTCWIVNNMKRHLSDKEFIFLCKKISALN